MVVCYLAWAKLGCDYLKLSIILGGTSASPLKDNMNQTNFEESNLPKMV
jgi:hypothetical protein